MTFSDPLVVLEGVVKEYPFGSGFLRALDEINLNASRGRLLALLGPSGSGKTTLLNLIGGLGRPTGGRVVIDNVDLQSLDRKALTQYRLRKVGFIFQGFNLVPNLSALDNVLLPLEFAGVSAPLAMRRAMELLAMVGLADRSMHTPERLSGGEQQRVLIVRALANDPPLILADDPIGNLDSQAGGEIVRLLGRLVREGGKTVIVAGYHTLIEEAADEIVHIRDGRIREQAMNSPQGGPVSSNLR